MVTSASVIAAKKNEAKKIKALHARHLEDPNKRVNPSHCAWKAISLSK